MGSQAEPGNQKNGNLRSTILADAIILGQFLLHSCPPRLGRTGTLPVPSNRRAGSPSYRNYGPGAHPTTLHHAPILIGYGQEWTIQRKFAEPSSWQ
jgi:hypothetical protein